MIDTHTCLQAVAFVQCDRKKLTGRVAEMREQLEPLLPRGSARTLQFPEYETQDDVCGGEQFEDNDNDSSDSSSRCGFL